ncbi:MFS transporter [Streptomyces sp. NPDC001922]|uniref:MFS transporter n=1 Tax=Streptomyces sp. NPDC001922 TaxID=3364624 RepID=UPI0036973210
MPAAAPGEGAPSVPESVVPAWRGGFGRLWTAAVVSRFGDALRGAALPLLAYGLTDSPLLISLVTAAGLAPWLLFGLLGGAVADRVDQRRAMWAVDTVRALLMAAFAVLVATGHASIALLILLAFALTTLQTLFDNAATALLPSVVPRAALGRANARLMTGQEAAHRFVGAPLVPVLLGVGLAAPYAVDAVSYLLAAVLVASVRTAAPERDPRPPGATLRRDIADGLRALWRHPVLRALCLSTAVCNVAIGALIGTLVLLVKGRLGAGDTGYALVITVYGVGTVAGGLLASRITERLGRTRVLLAGGLVQTGCLLALGTLPGLPAATVALGIFGFVGMVWNVTEVTMMQQSTPPELLGRVGAAFRTASVAGAPAGAVLGGAVAGAWGLNTPMLLAAGLFLGGVAALIPALGREDSRGTPRTRA